MKRSPTVPTRPKTSANREQCRISTHACEYSTGIFIPRNKVNLNIPQQRGSSPVSPGVDRTPEARCSGNRRQDGWPLVSYESHHTIALTHRVVASYLRARKSRYAPTSFSATRSTSRRCLTLSGPTAGLHRRNTCFPRATSYPPAKSLPTATYTCRSRRARWCAPERRSR